MQHIAYVELVYSILYSTCMQHIAYVELVYSVIIVQYLYAAYYICRACMELLHNIRTSQYVYTYIQHTYVCIRMWPCMSMYVCAFGVLWASVPLIPKQRVVDPGIILTTHLTALLLLVPFLGRQFVKTAAWSLFIYQWGRCCLHCAQHSTYTCTLWHP